MSNKPRPRWWSKYVNLSLGLRSSITTKSNDAAHSRVPEESLLGADSEDPLDRERIVQLGLGTISDSLSRRYQQVCADLRHTNRLSWTGCAHEIRDMLSFLLRTMAPDDQVLSQAWFRADPNTSGPTQAQRVRFILEENRRKNEIKMSIETLELIDGLVARITRGVYAVGSNHAHTSAEHQDCVLLLFYFDALVVSLIQ
jgi:hypothetical protein